MVGDVADVRSSVVSRVQKFDALLGLACADQYPAERIGYRSGSRRKLVCAAREGQRVRPIQADLAKTTKSLRAALETAEDSLEEVDGMMSENSEFRYQIDIFLREITLMARSLRSFADYLERNPDALIRGKVRREGKK